MTQTNQSKSQHIQALAEELVADVELGRLIGQNLLLKALRLAQLRDDHEAYQWLRFEVYGYESPGSDAVSDKYVQNTGRHLIDTRASFQQLEVHRDACESRLQFLEKTRPVFNTGGEEKIRALKEVMGAKTILARVLAMVYEFATRVYCESRFSGIADAIFDRYRAVVDAKLATSCGDVLQKIPSVYDRLMAGDAEAISQALTTCRRVLESFADAVNPPSDRTIQVDGNPVTLDKGHWRARVREYLDGRVDSTSRKDRLNHALRDLANRVSTGVHDDVAPDEAKALFLHTYLFVGEVITLADPPPPARPLLTIEPLQPGVSDLFQSE